MRKIRVERVGEQIKKEVSRLLQRELKDPRVGFVTVTDVEVSGDLQQAKVYVSILGDEKERTETLQGLERAKGFIRSEVGKSLQVRHTPEIHFVLDRSIAHGSRIAQLLNEIQRQGERSEE